MNRIIYFSLSAGFACVALAGLVSAVLGGAYALERGLSIGAAIMAGVVIFLPFASVGFMLVLGASAIRKKLGSERGRS